MVFRPFWIFSHICQKAGFLMIWLIFRKKKKSVNGCLKKKIPKLHAIVALLDL